MKSKIRISQLIAKILLKQRNLNQIRHCFTGHIQIWLNFFDQISESKFLSFVTKVNSNNENETKPDIFSWDIFKTDIIFQWSQNTKIFQWLL